LQQEWTAEQVFAVLSDRPSIDILKVAYQGRLCFSNYAGKLSKKQFYTKLKRLCNAGLVEKREDAYYRTTTLGSLVYNGHVKTLEEALTNFWQLKSIDILKSREDFPADRRESIIDAIVKGSNLKNFINSTHLTGFAIIKDFNRLIIEVIRMLEDAKNEIYFASRYHDPHVSKKMLEKVEKGVNVHLLDGNQPQISVENRLNAILRTPPNEETFRTVNRLIRSHCFELKNLEPTSLDSNGSNTVIPKFNSFLVIDGNQVIYENINYGNPEQFTVAIARYDDTYLAEQFINYWKMLSKDAMVPKLLQDATART
jgi:DNA-binding transcriptional ArsR family regulator